MLNLSRLHLLYELSTLGTIQAVADRLKLTRPAVSQQLSLLERELNTVLFERNSRGVQLTPAGRRLAARAGALLELVDDIEAELSASYQTVSGEVRLAAFGSVASTIVPLAIERVLRSHPDLRITFSELEPPEGMRAAASKQVDIAIVDGSSTTAAAAQYVELRAFCQDFYKVVISADHRLASGEEREIQLSQLTHEKWAINQTAVTYYEDILNACRDAGFTPDIASSCRNISATLELVRTGYYITALPGLACMNIVGDPDFSILPLQPTLSRQIFTAVSKTAARRPAVATMLRALERAVLSVGLAVTAPSDTR